MLVTYNALYSNLNALYSNHNALYSNRNALYSNRNALCNNRSRVKEQVEFHHVILQMAVRILKPYLE